MPSLSDKLKALGVNVGTDGIAPSSKTTKYPIEKIVDGQEVNTPFGQTFVVEKTYTSDPRSENVPLRFTASLATMSTWISDPNVVRHNPKSFAFLDTETSGGRQTRHIEGCIPFWITYSTMQQVPAQN